MNLSCYATRSWPKHRSIPVAGYEWGPAPSAGDQSKYEKRKRYNNTFHYRCQQPRKQGGLGDIKYPLVADHNAEIAKKYGVYCHHEGNAYRALFIIDRAGLLRQITVNDVSITWKEYPRRAWGDFTRARNARDLVSAPFTKEGRTSALDRNLRQFYSLKLLAPVTSVLQTLSHRRKHRRLVSMSCLLRHRAPIASHKLCWRRQLTCASIHYENLWVATFSCILRDNLEVENRDGLWYSIRSDGERFLRRNDPRTGQLAKNMDCLSAARGFGLAAALVRPMLSISQWFIHGTSVVGALWPITICSFELIATKFFSLPDGFFRCNDAGSGYPNRWFTWVTPTDPKVTDEFKALP